MRGPLLACRAKSSVPASLSQGLTIPRCLTIPGWADWQSEGVVYIGGLTPVKIFFRLRLQNLFPGVCPPMVAECKWLAVVLWCACLRVEVMVSMSARCSKGGGYGFNI